MDHISLPNKQVFLRTFPNRKFWTYTKYIEAIRDGYYSDFKAESFKKLFPMIKVDRLSSNWKQATIMECFARLIDPEGSASVEVLPWKQARSRMETIYVDRHDDSLPTVLAFHGVHSYRISTVADRLMPPDRPKQVRKKKKTLLIED